MLRRVLVTLAVLVVIAAVAAGAGLHYAAGALRDKVRQALGPDSEVAAIALGWSAVEVTGVRVPAPKDWPAPDALRAERIVVTPDFNALFGKHEVRISRIVVERAYLSVFRTREGKLRLLPGMLEKPPAAGKDGTGKAAPGGDDLAVSIDAVDVNDAALEIYDASVAKPPHKVRLEQLQARVGALRLPALTGRTSLDLQGVVKGVQRDGRMSVNGWIELASKDSEIATRLQGVDLVGLQPYLIKASETGVRQGSLDLDLKSTVKQNRLHAPGSLAIANLELASGKGGSATFMGMPRAAVVGLLKDKNGRISIKFALEGRLDDPRFSLNEAFMTRIGTSMAEGLGVSLESVAKGVSSTTQGIGSSLGKLFGK